MVVTLTSGVLEKSEFDSRIGSLRNQHDREAATASNLRGEVSSRNTCGNFQLTRSLYDTSVLLVFCGSTVWGQPRKTPNTRNAGTLGSMPRSSQPVFQEYRPSRIASANTNNTGNTENTENTENAEFVIPCSLCSLCLCVSKQHRFVVSRAEFVAVNDTHDEKGHKPAPKRNSKCASPNVSIA